MSVRITESGFPAGFTADKLGQAFVDPANASIALISFQSSPLARQRPQQYYVFVTNATIAATVASYEWTLNDNGTSHTQQTSIGHVEFTPANTGTLGVTVKLMTTANVVITTLNLQQTVLALNPQLETLIDQQDKNIPAAGHPATSREIINDLRVYADREASPTTAPYYNKLLLSICYRSILGNTQLVRKALMETSARLFNNSRPADFLANARNGIGVCKIRPQLLAMVLDDPANAGSKYIEYKELAGKKGAQVTIQKAIDNSFKALSPDKLVGLFNLCRFPSSAFQMSKKILDELGTRYGEGKPFEEMLKDPGHKAKATTVLSQYETGPVEVKGKFKPTKASSAIYGMLSHALWKIPAATASGTPAGAGVPAGTTPAAFGAPEHIPDANMTFVAKPKVTDNGFIRGAFQYHETYGLKPVTVESIEDLVNKLAANTGTISRMRLVSHFFLDEKAKNPSNLNMAFFNLPAGTTDKNVPPVTHAGHFKYGISDEEGISFLVDEFMKKRKDHISDGTLLQFDRNNPTKKENILKVVLDIIRANNVAVLVPFSLQGAKSKASGSTLEFIKYCLDKLYLDKAKYELEKQSNASTLPMPALVKTTMVNAIDKKISDIGASLVKGKIKIEQVNAFRDAILQIPDTELAMVHLKTFTSTIIFPDVFIENHQAFRTNLAKVKDRFTSSSIIDIRGCRIGQDLPYMTALRSFFGKTGSEPIITSPDWFQSFQHVVDVNLTSNAQISAIIKQGFTVTFTSFKGKVSKIKVTEQDILREYSNWSGRIGTPSQLTFWTTFTTADPLEFLSYEDWKNNVPTLGMEAKQVQNLGVLSFTDMIQRLAEIFSITGAAKPTTTILQTFTTTVLPGLQALRQQHIAISQMTATTPAAELTTRLQSLTQIATQFSQTFPAAPNPITLAYVQACLVQLKQHVKTKLDIAPFLAAIAEFLKLPNANILYYLNIGLPLPVQSATKEEVVGLMMISAQRDDTIKNWMKSQWAEALPAGNMVSGLTVNWSGPEAVENGPGHNDDDLTDKGRATQVAALNFPRENAQFAIVPMYEYQQHIKSLP